MTDIHTHIEKNSRDCDGDYENNWIETRRLAIWELPTTYEGSGTYDLSFELPDDDAPDHENEILYILDAGCLTEEGYEHIRAYECRDESCDLKKTSRRDHTAEAAGY